MQGGEIWLLPAHRLARILGVLLRPDASGALGWMVWVGEIPAKVLKFDSRSSMIRNKYCIFTTWQCFVGSDGHEWKNKGVLVLHGSILMFS